MNKFILLVFIYIHSFAQSADIIGYLPDHRVDDKVLKRVKLCTDIVYFGSEITESGKIKMPAAGDQHLRKLRQLCLKHKVRLHLCLGGWKKDQYFPKVTASPEKRALFLKDLQSIVEQYDLDGVDYDWEYPKTASEMTHFTKLCKETKVQQGKDFLVTAAFHPRHKIPQELTDVLDRVHLMTYDGQGKHCDISIAKRAIKDWESNHVPKEKICVGAAFYSRKTTQRSSVKTYAQMIKEYGHKKVNKMPVDGYFGDNQASLIAKSKLIRAKKIRGIIIWEIGQDSDEDSSSLLSTLNKELK